MATDNEPPINGQQSNGDHHHDGTDEVDGVIGSNPPAFPCFKCSQLTRQLNEALDELDKARFNYQNEKEITNQLSLQIQNMEGQIFNYSKEMDHFKGEERKVEKLTTELQNVSKKAAVIGEMYSKLKDKMNCLSANYMIGSTDCDQLELKADNLERELEHKSRELCIKTRELDYFKAKSAENELIIADKDDQILQLNALIVKIREDNKKKMAVERARIVALEHSRDAYESRILKMNEERGLPITTNGLSVPGGHGHHVHGSSASSTTLTAPSTSNPGGHSRDDDSSDSYVELSD